MTVTTRSTRSTTSPTRPIPTTRPKNHTTTSADAKKTMNKVSNEAKARATARQERSIADRQTAKANAARLARIHARDKKKSSPASSTCSIASTPASTAFSSISPAFSDDSASPAESVTFKAGCSGSVATSSTPPSPTPTGPVAVSAFASVATANTPSSPASTTDSALESSPESVTFTPGPRPTSGSTAVFQARSPSPMPTTPSPPALTPTPSTPTEHVAVDEMLPAAFICAPWNPLPAQTYTVELASFATPKRKETNMQVKTVVFDIVVTPINVGSKLCQTSKDDLQMEVEDLRAENADLRYNLRKAQEDITDMELSHSECQEALSIAEKERDNSKRYLQQVTADIGELVSGCQKGAAINKALSSDLESITSLKNDLAAERDQALQTAQHLQAKLSKSHHELGKLERVSARLKVAGNVLRAQNLKLSSELEDNNNMFEFLDSQLKNIRVKIQYSGESCFADQEHIVMQQQQQPQVQTHFTTTAPTVFNRECLGDLLDNIRTAEEDQSDNRWLNLESNLETLDHMTEESLAMFESLGGFEILESVSSTDARSGMEEVPLGCQNTANKLVVKFKGYRDIPIPFHLDTGPASATTSATAVGTPEVMKSVADANIVLGPLFQDLIQVEEASSLSSPINPTPSITLKSNPVPPRVLQQISLDKPFQVTKRKVFDLPRLKDLVQGAEVTSSSLLTCPSPSSALTFDSVPRTAFQELPLKSSSVSSGSNSYEFSSNHLKQMIQRIRNPGIMRTGSENKNNILEQDLYSLSVMPDSCIASFKNLKGLAALEKVAGHDGITDSLVHQSEALLARFGNPARLQSSPGGHGRKMPR